MYKNHAFIFRGRPPKWSGTVLAHSNYITLCILIEEEIQSILNSHLKRIKCISLCKDNKISAMFEETPQITQCNTVSKHQRWARATFFWVRNRNSAIWKKHFRNHNMATFKEMLLRNWDSTTAIFSEVHNFKSATWKLQFCNFWHIFGRGIRSVHGEKIGGKKSCATVPLRQVLGFQRNRGF